MIEFNKEGFLNDALGAVGDVLVDNAKSNMDKVSFGRVYVIGGRPHIASKAGETANNLSGALKDTIRYEVQGEVLEFGAGNERVDYAKYLEKGTSKMQERPNYTKTLLQNEEKINQHIEDALIKNLKVKNVK